MKNSDLIIRTQRMLPEVYSDESRDFLVFTKLMDAVYNSCMYNTEGVKFLNDPHQVNSRLLTLFADKLGIDIEDANTMTDEELRFLICCLSTLLKYKGSVMAVVGLVNIFFKVFHISGSYELNITDKVTFIQETTLSPRTIVLGLETTIESTRLLYIMGKYLLPPGYGFYVYFYSTSSSVTLAEVDENMTLLFRSTNLGTEIGQEIPDFIRNAEYTWYTNNEFEPLEYLPARVSLLISALDTTLLTSIISNTDRTKFAGFIDKSKFETTSSTWLDTFNTKYNNAIAYSSAKDDPYGEKSTSNPYTAMDIYTTNAGADYWFYNLLHGIVDTHNIFATKTKLVDGTLLIVSSTEESSTLKATGDIYYFTLTPNANGEHWHKLVYCGTYENQLSYENRTLALPNITTDNISEWDYSCIVTKKLPFLTHVNLTTNAISETPLTELDAAYQLPIRANLNDLCYSLSNSTYYVCTTAPDLAEQIPSFAETTILNSVTFTKQSDNSYDVDGFADKNTVFTIATNITLAANNSYLLSGCLLKNGRQIPGKLVLIKNDTALTIVQTDTGHSVIFTPETNTTVSIAIIIPIDSSLDHVIFKPTIINLTTSFSTVPSTMAQFFANFWTAVTEGPLIQDQNTDYGSIVQDNMVFWRRGGNYYICLNINGSNKWVEYTEPLFFTKLIQRKKVVEE